MNMPGLIVPGWNANLNKPIPLGVPYFLPMSIALTGTQGENITGQTPQTYNTDLLIHGGSTNLQTSQVQFQLPGSLPTLWSQSSVSVRALFGQEGSSRPYLRFPYPLRLPVGRFLSATVLNSQGEGAGTFVFMGSQPQQAPPSVAGVSQDKNRWFLDPKRLGPMQVIPVNSQLTGTASQQTSSDGVLNPVDYDFLWLGTAADFSIAGIQIIDVERRQWQPQLTVGGSNLCPVWAVAGGPNSEQWMQYLPVPYVIPRNKMPTFNFQNDATNPEGAANSSPQLYLFGQQLLD